MEYATPRGSVLFESLWRTRYENLVPVNEMESEHIINTINYLEQQVQRQHIECNHDDWHLPITELPHTEHNIEVLKRELVRRTQ